MNALSMEEREIFTVMVEFHKKGHSVVSLGNVCEQLGIDKSEIPDIFYTEYYELDDFYKQNIEIAEEVMTSTLH